MVIDLWGVLGDVAVERRRYRGELFRGFLGVFRGGFRSIDLVFGFYIALWGFLVF